MASRTSKELVVLLLNSGQSLRLNKTRGWQNGPGSAENCRTEVGGAMSGLRPT